MIFKDPRDEDMLWDIMFTALFIILIILVAPTFSGCSTYTFIPKCKCECRENNSTFECLGDTKYEQFRP